MDESIKANEIIRIDKRNEYARMNYGQLQTDDLNLEVYINKTISDSIRIDYHEGVSDGYRNLALHYIISDSSIDVYEILQKIEKLIKAYDLDEKHTLNLYSAYVVYYLEVIGDVVTGTTYAKKGLEIAEKLNDKEMVMRLKSNLGVVYIGLGHIEGAKELLESALEYYMANNDVFHIMYVYNNLAEVYLISDSLSQAKNYYQKALDIAKDKNEVIIITDASKGLSEIYCLEKHYTDAIEIINEVISYLKLNNNIKFEIEANIQLASIYVKQGISQAAYNILVSLDDNIKILENQTVLISYYELYSKVAKELGEYEAAFHAHTKYHEYYIKIHDLKAERAISEVMKSEYKKTINRLETIATVGRELSTLANIDEVLFEVKEILSRLMDINGIGIGEVVGDKIVFNHFLVEGYKMELQAVSLIEGNSLAAWSVNNNKEVQINDIDNEFGLYVKEIVRKTVKGDGTDKRKDGVKSLLYAPLIVKGETLGVFTIQSFKKNAFLSEEFEMFRIIVAYVAIAFKNISQSLALEKLSLKDSLTGINNRRGFTDYYQSMIDQVDYKINLVSIIMLDLDYFKKINDVYSHVAGDEVLIRVAKVLMDKEEQSIISARLGGEEFGFVIFNKNKQYVYDFAQKIRSEIENLEVAYKETIVKVTTSIGISSEKYTDETDFKQLYFEADKALFYAKESGRNRVEVFNEEILSDDHNNT